MATNTGPRADIKTMTTRRVCASPHSIGSASWRFLPWFLLQPFMTLNTQGPPTTSTSTPGTAKESNQCDPRCSDCIWNQNSLLGCYWCPITIVFRSYTLNFYAENLYPKLQTCSCISSVLLQCLDGMFVSQVRGGHSVQWQVCSGEPSCERCLQADGGGGHEHFCQFEQGWLEVKEIHHAQPEAHSNHRTNDFDCIYGFFFFDRELRSLVVEMVMSTDMSCHFQQIKTMKNALTQTDKLELKTQSSWNPNIYPSIWNKTLILHIALHLRHIYKFAEIEIRPCKQFLRMCSHRRIIIELDNTWSLHKNSDRFKMYALSQPIS